MNALMREWRRFTPMERFTRWAVYFALVLALVTAVRKVEIIPEFLIDAPEQLQVARTQQRDNTSEDAVKSIMTNQFSRHQRQSVADDIILNNSSLEALYAAVDGQHKKYLERYS